MSIEFIATSFNDRMAANYTETPVAYDNTYFDNNALDKWVRLSVIPGSPKPMGAHCYRERGNLVASVFVKRESEATEAYRLADVIGNLFKLQRVNGIVMELPEIVRVGITSGDSENWFQINVFVGYYYDTNN